MEVNHFRALNISYHLFWSNIQIENDKGDKLGALVGRKKYSGVLRAGVNDFGVGSMVVVLS